MSRIHVSLITKSLEQTLYPREARVGTSLYNVWKHVATHYQWQRLLFHRKIIFFSKVKMFWIFNATHVQGNYFSRPLVPKLLSPLVLHGRLCYKFPTAKREGVIGISFERTSVSQSVTFSCPLHISHIIWRTFTKLGLNVKLTKTMCRKHDSAIFGWRSMSHLKSLSLCFVSGPYLLRYLKNFH